MRRGKDDLGVRCVGGTKHCLRRLFHRLSAGFGQFPVRRLHAYRPRMGKAAFEPLNCPTAQTARRNLPGVTEDIF